MSKCHWSGQAPWNAVSEPQPGTASSESGTRESRRFRRLAGRRNYFKPSSFKQLRRRRFKSPSWSADSALGLSCAHNILDTTATVNLSVRAGRSLVPSRTLGTRLALLSILPRRTIPLWILCESRFGYLLRSFVFPFIKPVPNPPSFLPYLPISSPSPFLLSYPFFLFPLQSPFFSYKSFTLSIHPPRPRQAIATVKVQTCASPPYHHSKGRPARECSRCITSRTTFRDC